jgi:hypothetical protein
MLHIGSVLTSVNFMRYGRHLGGMGCVFEEFFLRIYVIIIWDYVVFIIITVAFKLFSSKHSRRAQKYFRGTNMFKHQHEACDPNQFEPFQKISNSFG